MSPRNPSIATDLQTMKENMALGCDSAQMEIRVRTKFAPYLMQHNTPEDLAFAVYKNELYWEGSPHSVEQAWELVHLLRDGLIQIAEILLKERDNGKAVVR